MAKHSPCDHRFQVIEERIVSVRRVSNGLCAADFPAPAPDHQILEQPVLAVLESLEAERSVPALDQALQLPSAGRVLSRWFPEWFVTVQVVVGGEV